MILDNAQIKDYEVEQSGDDIDGGEVSIDTSNMGLFYDMMSKSIYSNPHGSIIRELVSNGFDANTEAVEAGIYPEGTRKPVVIKTYSEEGERWLAIQDYGIGISKERFHSVYLKYLSSTKRASNKFLGAFGLGSKSPFSYTDVFYITTRYEGREYYYVMSKGQQATPNWDLLYEKETTESNGTTVKFIIEGGKYGSDYSKFQNEIIGQLRYFDDVYIEGFDISNEYKIFDFKTFKFRKDTTDTVMHIALGKVTYPIDWNILKRSQVRIPVGVKFDIGELMITSNRESIRYNDEVIDVINKRIDESLAELQKLAAHKNYDTLAELKTAQANSRYDRQIPITEDTIIRISPNGKYDKDGQNAFDIKVDPPQWTPFAGTPIVVPHDPFFIFKSVGATDRYGSYTSRMGEDKKRKLPREMHDVYALALKHKLYRTNDFKLSKQKMFYLGKLMEEENKGKQRFYSSDYAQAVIITKDNHYSVRQILELLKLQTPTTAPFNKRGRKQAAPIITENYNKLKLVKLYRREMEKEIIKLSTSYDRLELPEDVLAEWKAQFIRIKQAALEGEIPMMDYSVSIEKKELTNLNVLKHPLVVYGGNSDKNQLIAIQRILSSRNFKKRRIKKIKNYPNGINPYRVIGLNNVDFKRMTGGNQISLAEFTTKHKVFIEQATAYFIYRDYQKLDLQWVTTIMPSVKHWRDKISDFIDRTIGNEQSRNSVLESKFVQQLLEIAESQGLIIKEYVEITKGLLTLQEDLFLIKGIHDAHQPLNFTQRKEVASFIVKKGYPVDPVYFFKPNEQEQAWIDSLVKYVDNQTDFWTKKLVPKYTEESYEELLREAYEARKNNNYSLYTPIKSWHKNFQQSSGNKSVKISTLLLTQTDSLSL